MSDTSLPARPRRIAFPPNWPARISLAVLALYVLYASTVLDITWARFLIGLEQGSRFLSRRCGNRSGWRLLG